MFTAFARSAARSTLSLLIFLTTVSVILVLFLGNVGCERGSQAFSVGYNKGYTPEQPIPFSHNLHATTYTIPCQYCHTTVTESRHATIPSLNICMNCHVAVKTDSPWIKKIRSNYEAGVSIPWVKVHMLPDFVQFNHAPHIKKGVTCQTCHGEIQTMERVSQFTDLSMGWCVNCHRKPENNAPINCGACHY